MGGTGRQEACLLCWAELGCSVLPAGNCVPVGPKAEALAVERTPELSNQPCITLHRRASRAAGQAWPKLLHDKLSTALTKEACAHLPHTTHGPTAHCPSSHR